MLSLHPSDEYQVLAPRGPVQLAQAHGRVHVCFARRFKVKEFAPVAVKGSLLPYRYFAEVRAAQLAETLSLVRYSALMPVLVAAGYIAFFWTTPGRFYTFVLLFLVALLAVMALAAASYLGPRATSNRSVGTGHAIAAALACMVGIVWGTMPIALFAGADALHRLIIVATTIGIVANVYLLGPILAVNLLFVVPVLFGGFLGLAQSQDTDIVPLMLLLCVYAGFMVTSITLLQRFSLQRMVDRARVGEQSDTIGLLMKDSEDFACDYLWELDRSDRLERVSQRLADAVGRTVSDLDAAPFSVLFARRSPSARATPDLDGAARQVLAAIAGRRSFHNLLVEMHRDGRQLEWQFTGKPVFDRLGAFAGYRGVASDVTAVRTAQARVAYLASKDATTGLANRTTLHSHVEQECASSLVDGITRALLYIDLDGFKAVNDEFGHRCGDDLLKEVGRRLGASMPAGGMVGRLGGDEFAIMFASSSPASAETLARRLISIVSMPYELEGSLISIGASIGLAYAPDDATDANSLLTKADLAMYQAKASGKGSHRVFVQDYEQTRVARRQLEEDLKLALARQEFALLYQPQVDLATGRVTAFEALIRWTSPTRGAVSPASFIPTAEAVGLITSIGRWVLVQACKDAMAWDGDIRVAVNISPPHFRAPDFVQDVFVALQMSGLEPNRLEIEITEGVFLDSSAAAIANLHALRKRGISIALDDFGTGFSSLNYLVNFPVDKIKIDRSFIARFTDRHENRAIVEAILSLAKNLSIRVTAEGVETVDQAIALRHSECDEMQGFLISKAQPVDRCAELIRCVPDQVHALMPNSLSLPAALQRCREREGSMVG